MATQSRDRTLFVIVTAVLAADAMSQFTSRKVLTHLAQSQGAIAKRFVVLGVKSEQREDQFVAIYFMVARANASSCAEMERHRLVHYLRSALNHDLKGLRQCFGLYISKLQAVHSKSFTHAVAAFRDRQVHEVGVPG
jgi:hypothetical protein